MKCWLKEEYTLYDQDKVLWIEKWNHEWKYFRDRVIELTPCEAKFFDWVNSDCQEIRIATAKHISKLLSEIN